MNLIKFQAIRKFSYAESSKVELSKNLWDELINNGARNLPANADDNKGIIIRNFKISNVLYKNQFLISNFKISN